MYETIQAFFNYIVICGVCTWYFTSTQDSQGHFRLYTGFSWGLLFNFGSIAFGALVISPCWFFRMVFEWLGNQLAEPTYNPISKSLAVGCGCCLSCFHRFVKFLDENAYIQVALTCDPLCTAAYSAFCLALKNSSTFLITNGIGTIMRFLGRVSICIANTFIGYLIIDRVGDLNKDIDNPIVILAVIFLISFAISSVFMDIYAVISLTILQCLYTDVDICRQNQEGDALNNRYRPAEM